MEIKKYSLENFKKFFVLGTWATKEIYKTAPFDTIILGILTIVSSCLPVILAFFNAQLLDEIVVAIQTRPNPTVFLSLQHPFSQIVLVVALIGVLNHIIVESWEYIESKFRIYHMGRYANNLNLKVSSLDIAYFEDPIKANEIDRAVEHFYRIREFFISAIKMLANLTRSLIGFVVLAYFSLPFASVMAIMSLPYSYFFMKWIRNDWDFDMSVTERIRRRRSAVRYLTNDSSIRENRLLEAIPFLRGFLEKETEFISLGFLRIRRLLYREQLLSSTLVVLQDILAIAYPLIKALGGGMTVGDFSFYSSRARSLTYDIHNTLNDFSQMYEASLGIDKVKNVMDMENTIIGGKKKTARKALPKIEFRNVYFKYPQSQKYVISDFNLTINPGEEIAIVGENGAGKTTFIKLLLRFYDVTSGQILIDGTDIKELDLNSYYKIIGTLFQDYQIYKFLTIDENIEIGSKGGDERKRKESLKAAEAYDFVDSTKLKGKHRLNKQHEDGIQLSTGQEQKLALARMFYRDAPILILDEPTASIDAVAEYKIFNRIYRFMKNKTVIIISHRFSTVRKAQKIYVFDKGRVIEQGSHKELLEKDGVYAKAFKLQAEGYTN